MIRKKTDWLIVNHKYIEVAMENWYEIERDWLFDDRKLPPLTERKLMKLSEVKKYNLDKDDIILYLTYKLKEK